MSAPTAKLRDMTYRRDGNRCVSCGTATALEWQHRQATGMGGRGRKAPVLTASDGITACTVCNGAFEHKLQSKAIRSGWKVKKFSPVPTKDVPVWYPLEKSWFVLNPDGSRDAINQVNADELMAMAGVIPGDGVMF